MTHRCALLVSIIVALAACSANLGPTWVGPGGGGRAGADDPGDGEPGSPEPQATVEECNGYDDDLDGIVDDGCGCDEGQTQACWAGVPGQEELGTCAPGIQECDTSVPEFPEWGPCRGTVPPGSDLCDDGIDQDCDGQDRSCDAPDDGAPVDPADDPAGPDGNNADDPADPDGNNADDPAQDPGGGNADNDCVPAAELCGNGVDEDCDGADAVCDIVEVDLFIIGDCVTARCPANAPYPVGCNVFFTPGDDRGCIASQPDDSTVYFQAGDQCDQGLVTGTLLCSAAEGDPLDAGNCPINKPVPIYAGDRAGCPATH